MESEFPSNSKTNKKPPVSKKVEEKNVSKITTGEVIKRKKSWFKKFREKFISDTDNRSVLEHVTFEILIPAAKVMVTEAVNAGMNRKLYGEGYSPRRRNLGHSVGQTAYHRMGRASRPMVNDLFGREDPRAPSLTQRARANHDFEEIILETRVDATEVIDSLFELISKFEVATVADLYDLVGVESSYTDRAWGWVDLRGSDVVRVSNGYLLSLPRPEPLD